MMYSSPISSPFNVQDLLLKIRKIYVPHLPRLMMIIESGEGKTYMNLFFGCGVGLLLPELSHAPIILEGIKRKQ